MFWCCVWSLKGSSYLHSFGRGPRESTMQDIWASGVCSQLFAACLLNTCLYFCAYYLAWDSVLRVASGPLLYSGSFSWLSDISTFAQFHTVHSAVSKVFCHLWKTDWGRGAVLISFLGKPTSLLSRGPNSHSPLPIIRAGKMAEVASTSSNLRKTALLNKNTKLKVLTCIYNSVRRQN